MARKRWRGNERKGGRLAVWGPLQRVLFGKQIAKAERCCRPGRRLVAVAGCGCSCGCHALRFVCCRVFVLVCLQKRVRPITATATIITTTTAAASAKRCLNLNSINIPFQLQPQRHLPAPSPALPKICPSPWTPLWWRLRTSSTSRVSAQPVLNLI